MIARIVLPGQPKFSVADFSTSLKENLEGAAEVDSPRKADGKVTLKINSATLQLGASSKPVKWNDLKHIIESSARWPIDRAAIESHVSQLVFRISGHDPPLQQAMILTAAVSTALEQTPDAIGVFWESAGHVVPVRAWQSLVKDPNEVSSIWVGTWVSPAGPNGAKGCSQGMAAFGQREIETQQATESPQELHARMTGLINYLLQNGPIVKDNETFGQTKKEKIRVRYADQSSFGNKGPVMNLDYAGTRVIPANQGLQPSSRVSQPNFQGRTSRLPLISGTVVATVATLALGWFLLSFLGGEKTTAKSTNEKSAAQDGSDSSSPNAASAETAKQEPNEPATESVTAAKTETTGELEQEKAGSKSGDRSTNKVVDNNVDLRFKWNKDDEHVYHGELESIQAGARLESSLRLSFDVGVGGTLTGSGICHVTLFDQQGGSIRGDGFFMVDSFTSSKPNGEVNSYSGRSYVPLMSSPVALLPIIDLPSDGSDSWETESQVIVKTVQVRMDPSPPVVETRIQYDTLRSAGEGLDNIYGGRRPDGIPGMEPPPGGGLPYDNPTGGPTPERELLTSKAIEKRSYRITDRQGQKVWITCDYELTSDEQPQPNHKLTYTGTYVFDCKLGLITEIKLVGNARHSNTHTHQDAPFELTLSRKTPEQLAVEKKERDARLEKSKQARADRDKGEKAKLAAKEAEKQAELDSWLPENVLVRLASNDRDELRDVLTGLARDKVESPNAGVGLALIQLMKEAPDGTFITSTVIRKWITADLGPQLLEALPQIDGSTRIREAINLLKEFETPGLVECLITCLDSRENRGVATMALNEYDSGIEEKFYDTLTKSTNVEVLRITLDWIGRNGTRKSIGRIRRLARRLDDQVIHSRCDSAIRALERRR